MKRSGLTLIELLVAMSILAIIVLAVAQLFQQSTVAWESGYRRTRTAMVARAILGYVAADISLAAWGGDVTEPTSGSGFSFYALDGTNLLEQISYSTGGGDVVRNSVPLYESVPALSVEAMSATFALPYHADVTMDVKTVDKGREETRRFTTRVYLANRNRYYYD
ncbi:MAG: prepilin-type N-terminal cleavage/methylation domain-containing protein [Verrucomicrobia bacterium]|jgi:prepilin-type N-terminal cleavage/methylation domain-containing protein|nr:prepilin-type N-terminal cleavage/methylation domain-containing protein [Verrucomicrobiota bacterium]MBT7068745.1 prepilin-type N-terminal cleavage/methylation domain-containing protein [Verrucomicrobiota bacterium]MBT7698832.1 prepilin-type N-terminal cleavage/methylation domain-containing protein [Verrucomicrobiota bacterium]